MNMTTRAALAAGVALTCLALVSCDKARDGGAPPPVTKDGSAPDAPPPFAGKVELVELFAPWNPACRMQEPVTAEVARRYEGLAKVTRVDVEADEGAAKRYGIEAGPSAPVIAFVILVEGKVARRLEGLQSADELSAALDEALGRPQGGD